MSLCYSGDSLLWSTLRPTIFFQHLEIFIKEKNLVKKELWGFKTFLGPNDEPQKKNFGIKTGQTLPGQMTILTC